MASPNTSTLGASRSDVVTKRLRSANDGASGDDGYLRLVMHLERGHLSLTGARVIAGPLPQIDSIGDPVYRVLLDGRPIGLGGLPDLQLAKRLADPIGDVVGLEAVEHTLLALGNAEFVARIPCQEETGADLARLEVELLGPVETLAASRPDQTDRHQHC